MTTAEHDIDSIMRAILLILFLGGVGVVNVVEHPICETLHVRALIFRTHAGAITQHACVGKFETLAGWTTNWKSTPIDILLPRLEE